MDEDAPLLDMNGQVDEEWPESSKIEDGLGEAAQQHVATYRRGADPAAETHGNVCKWDGKRFEVWASTQTTFGVQNELARAQGRSVEVDSTCAEFVGGASAPSSRPASRASPTRSWRTRPRSVKLMLDRFEGTLRATAPLR